ncbi:hypothetical protein Aca07nite_76560 [Actinoplanes capillaceus]|uniref:Uncharacterized protein n=1 Tax=Actinoplanes campanulatus TaxID=113559 RepID=A0ABQ3WW54_9ACTN|nr:hypothetical protein Aca07nite_76560 [Actinoplanes capillaceus]
MLRAGIWRSIDLVFTIVDLATLLVAICAVIVSLYALRVAKQNADAADEAASHSARSADAAKDSADSARQVLGIEASRAHEGHRPARPGVGAFEYHKNTRTHTQDRFFTFHVDKTYRVKGVAIIGAGRSPLSVPLVAEAGEVRVYVDTMDKPAAERLHFQFWPPAEGDPGEAWSCPCGANCDSEAPAHWEWTVAVPPPKKRNVVYAM